MADVAIKLEEEIGRLKQELNAVILAHYYQESEIQDVADFVGDSLQLSRQAAGTDADAIVFAGVHFMAETAKILSPQKQVLLPDLNAGCSLSDDCPADKFEEFIKQYPGHTVISYVNCSAAVKALSDIIVTSSNAVSIVNQLPADEKIIFAPDQHLGRWVIKQTGRDMVLWPGSCIVHEIFSAKKIAQLQVRHPEAKVIAHPECQEAVLSLADFIGSTAKLLNYVGESWANEFIVVTEPGIIHQMEKKFPDRSYIPAPPDNGCSCNQCPHMRLNTMEKLYLCMKNREPEITMPEDVRIRALKPIERMLAMS
jgi:quinolinate synthase